MKEYILQFTTGGQIEINKEEAEAIAKTGNDQSITIKRLGVVIQKRMVQIFPKSVADKMHDRSKQQNGVLHDGARARKHFGRWVDYSEAPDDNGNFSPIKLDPHYYPETVLDCVATEEEYAQIRETGANYYEFLGIGNRTKRLENKTAGLQPAF
jgi:hypothetical protein